MTESTTKELYLELDSRQSNGMSVALLWDCRFNRTMIHLTDNNTYPEPAIDEIFHVPAENAYDAFNHPYYYYLNKNAAIKHVKHVTGT